MSRVSRVQFSAGAGLVCWAILMGTGPVHGQVQQPVGTIPQPAARPADEVLRASRVLGSSISIRGDVGIGTVDDIVLTRDGAVDYLVVRKADRYVLVPWQAARFNFERRTGVVDIPQETYREIPTFTRESWPNVYDPTYRTRIYRFYGIRPGAGVRIERREGIRP